MINPHLLRPAHKRQNDRRFAGGKFYWAVLVLPNGNVIRARVAFKRAHPAELYAKRLMARWIRLYDVAVVAAMQEDQAQTV